VLCVCVSVCVCVGVCVVCLCAVCVCVCVCVCRRVCRVFVCRVCVCMCVGVCRCVCRCVCACVSMSKTLEHNPWCVSCTHMHTHTWVVFWCFLACLPCFFCDRNKCAFPLAQVIACEVDPRMVAELQKVQTVRHSFDVRRSMDLSPRQGEGPVHFGRVSYSM
jgi:hypothetical protein